jgi:hypothetical protein
VTRDAWVEGWLYEEDKDIPARLDEEVYAAERSELLEDAVIEPTSGEETAQEPEKTRLWAEVLGSGYPSGSSPSQ